MSVFKVGQKWRTRDGKHTITITDVDNEGWVTSLDSTWFPSGQWDEAIPRDNPGLDLVTLVEDMQSGVVWINVYPRKSDVVYDTFSSKLDADDAEGDDEVLHRVACVKVLWTAGQYDE